MLSGLRRAFAGRTAATRGAGAFYSHAFIQCLAQRSTSAAAKVALFITPQTSIVGQKVGEEEYRWDATRSLLPPCSALIIPQQGQSPLLPLTCQDQMTFELC